MSENETESESETERKKHLVDVQMREIEKEKHLVDEVEIEKEKREKLLDLQIQYLHKMHPDDELQYEKGLINIFAYHCKRCNYVWIPKDLDVQINLDNQHITNKDARKSWKRYMLDREPPKCCARCKTKSWNVEPFEPIRSPLARNNALRRVRGLRLGYKPKPDPQEEKYLKRLAREYDEDEYNRRAARYLTKRSLKKQ